MANTPTKTLREIFSIVKERACDIIEEEKRMRPYRAEQEQRRRQAICQTFDTFSECYSTTITGRTQTVYLTGEDEIEDTIWNLRNSANWKLDQDDRFYLVFTRQLKSGGEVEFVVKHKTNKVCMYLN